VVLNRQEALGRLQGDVQLLATLAEASNST